MRVYTKENPAKSFEKSSLACRLHYVEFRDADLRFLADDVGVR